ncbi:hypothetical protein EDD76_10723 [Kineothrix alysoides]|uniref:Uncharacterized protein n=1 Tax=Kineothrix alysoides TaxID=1469948 RepID=A0A4R1QVB8_9FIRM|nr:hypothetical protein EDD76_10723 [Kineothrix alysoides]
MIPALAEAVRNISSVAGASKYLFEKKIEMKESVVNVKW